MPESLPGLIFDPAQLERLSQLADVDTSAPVGDWACAAGTDLAATEVVITGWGSPRIDAQVLARMPRLRAIVHTAGTVRFVVSAAVWQRRGLVATSSPEANAIPVAEFTLAQVLLSDNPSMELGTRHMPQRHVQSGMAVVGLIGASRIGRLVAELLRHFDIEVLISDPYVGATGIAALGGTKVELAELFSRSDVVSLHVPDVPSTQGMVSAELLALMREG